MKIYLKWFLIVSLNAVLGFILGYRGSTLSFALGMVFGVLSWCVLYFLLDSYFLRLGEKGLSRKLTMSACLRIPLQLFYFPEVFAGIAAIETLKWFGLRSPSLGFIYSYVLTLVTGLYLSGFCAAIFLLLTAFEEIKNRRKFKS